MDFILFCVTSTIYAAFSLQLRTVRLSRVQHIKLLKCMVNIHMIFEPVLMQSKNAPNCIFQEDSGKENVFVEGQDRSDHQKQRYSYLILP